MFTGFITGQVLFVCILALALILIALEILIPSFGIVGLLGGYLLIESILSIKNLQNPLAMILIAVLIAIVVVYIIIRYFVRNMDKNKMILSTDLKNSKGNGPRYSNEELTGKIGRVHKTLRPSGEVIIEGNIYEAVSYGDYIRQGEEIIVDKVIASKIYTKKI